MKEILKLKAILDLLIDAHKRGVKVEVFLNRAGDLATQNTEASLNVAERLLEAGIIKVYLVRENFAFKIFDSNSGN